MRRTNVGGETDLEHDACANFVREPRARSEFEATVHRFTLRWTEKDATCHRNQSNAVRVSRVHREGCSYALGAMPRDRFVALD